MTIHAAIEIGTTRTVLAVGESDGVTGVKITCHAEIPSAGIRKSQVADIPSAIQSVKSVIAEMEKRQAAEGSSLTLGNAFLTVNGQQVMASVVQGSVCVGGSRVTSDDVQNVDGNAQANAIGKDRMLIDCLGVNYELDNLTELKSPVGMSGRVLRCNQLHVHVDRDSLANFRAAAEGAKLEIRDPVFAPIAAANAVLEDNERKNGVLVLDFGGGSTGYAVFCDGNPAATGSVGVGGEHVTNDVAHAFQTTQAQAEELKKNESSALPGASAELSPRVELPGSSPLVKARTISRVSLNTVVNARLRELLAVIREKLDEQNLFQRLRAGVVITGGGAAQRDLETLIEREFQLKVRVGVPTRVTGLENVPHPETFASIAGTLLYAHQNYPEKPFFGGLFGGLFK